MVMVRTSRCCWSIICMVSKISLVLIKSIPPENQLKRGRFRRAGTSPAPTLQLPKTSRCRGRHPRAASLAPAGQFTFCPHRPAGGCGHPPLTSPAPTLQLPKTSRCRGRHPRAASLAPAGQFTFCPHRPAGGCGHPPLHIGEGCTPLSGPPREPSEAVRVGKRRPSGGSERSGLPGSCTPLSGPPREPSEAVRVGKRRPSGGSERSGLPGSE